MENHNFWMGKSSINWNMLHSYLSLLEGNLYKDYNTLISPWYPHDSLPENTWGPSFARQFLAVPGRLSGTQGRGQGGSTMKMRKARWWVKLWDSRVRFNGDIWWFYWALYGFMMFFFCEVTLGGFLKCGYPQIIRFSRIFHHKPSSDKGVSPIYGNLRYFFLKV